MPGIRTRSDRAVPYLEAAMRMPRTPPISSDGLSGRRNEQLAILVVLLLYVVIRLLAWHAAALVEDHGSISQLFHAKVFATWDLRQIAGLEPDNLPFYPLSIALLSKFGSLDTAARLSSFLFSLLLFFVVARIGQRIAGPWATAAGLVLLSLNPILARLSPAILTEPSYIATVYLGLWLFWRQLDCPTLGSAAATGLVFGLAFLGRVEAVLFMGAIPVFQAVHYFATRDRSYSGRQLAGWVLAFATCFTIVAGPQVGWESWRMGRFGLNGRQVWSEVMMQANQPYERQIYGLDYSPTVINLTYLQDHPEAMKTLRTSSQAPVPLSYGRLIAENLRDLVGSKLEILLGFFSCVLFVVGLVVMAKRGQRGDALLVLGFLAVTLAGPLLVNVVVRHIIIIAPIMLLVAGIAVMDLAERLASRFGRRDRALAYGAMLLLIPAGFWAPALRQAFHDKRCNAEYCVDTITRMSRIVRASAQDLSRPLRLSARKQYIAYYSGGTIVALPYTDYDGLLRYLRANGVDYLFLENWQIQTYPFLATFGERAPTDFILLDRDTDPEGRTSALYRVKPPTHAVVGLPPQ